MTFQFGDNPEYTISICWNIFSYSGHLALPFTITWWSCDAEIGKNIDIALWFLGLRFGLEIWKWERPRNEND